MTIQANARVALASVSLLSVGISSVISLLVWLTRTANEEMEKEIRELVLENDKDDEDPEPKKPKYNFDREMAMLSRKGASKVDIYKAGKRNKNKRETIDGLLKERDELKKEKVGLSKERSALIKALKVKKANKIRDETPANITEKNIVEMKKLSEFISARIKRWNKHDEPKSEVMAKEDTKYTLEQLYKHLPNSFVDFEYEEEIDVCRVLDLPCYGRAFGEDIEDHLHGPEHMVSNSHNPWSSLSLMLLGLGSVDEGESSALSSVQPCEAGGR